MKFTSWKFWALALVVIVATLWIVGCVSRTAPPAEIVQDLKLPPEQVAKGYTAAEIDALFLRWQAKANAEAEAAKIKADRAAADAKAEADRKAAALEAENAQAQAEAAVTLEALEAEHRTKVARFQLDAAKAIRQATSNTQAAILEITRKADEAAANFKTFLREQSDKAQAVSSGIAAAKADLERQDYLKSSLSSIGLQAATPFLPAGVGMLATGIIGSIIGQRKGEQNASEPTRALMSATKAAGVADEVGKYLADHAEPADLAVLARLGLQDGTTIQVRA